VLARNIAIAGGELDLVVERDGVVAICEVKYRDSRSGLDPLEALGPAQRARLRRAAGAWIAEFSRQSGRHWRARLDFVALRGPGVVEVVEDAW